MPEFDCPTPVTVSARLGGGVLDIVAEPRQTALVEVSPWDNSESSRATAERTVVDLRGGRLSIEPPEASGWLLRRGARVRVTVRIPPDCPLDIKVASAEVRCQGQYGATTLSTASGDVAIEHVAGDASIHTASGHVLVDRVDGRASARGASGDVTLTMVGGEVTATTASGDVAIDEADASVKVSTASGDVRIGRVRRGVVRLKCASGSQSVGVQQGTSVWLDVATVTGRTRSDLDMTGSGPTGGQSELTLALRTASGDIDIHRVTAASVA
jgi:hypothetical protein